MDAARRWLFGRRPNAGCAFDRIGDFGDDLKANRRYARSNFTVEGQPKGFAICPAPFYRPSAGKVLRGVDLILPNSWMELQAIVTYLGDFCCHGVVPNAVDPHDFDDPDLTELPQELQGKPFALMTPRDSIRANNKIL